MRLSRLMLFGLLVVCIASLAFAGGDEKMTGKELFKSKCRVCHGKDAAAGELTPLDYIQDQWDRFFTKKFGSSHEKVDFPESGKNKK